MKKFFQFLFIIICIAVVTILVIGAVEPRDLVITRSTLVKAPKDTIFQQIVHFRNWTNWSPWYQLDSSMKLTYDGTDGQPGSSYHWVGDENKVGEGEMKNDEVKENSMAYELHILKPLTMDATGTLAVKDTDKGNAKVTWTLTKHTNYPLNAMWIFVDMDKLMGKDFETGLANMKNYVESHTEPPLQITEVDFPAQVYEGIKQSLFWIDMNKFFMDTYRKIGRDIGDNVGGPAVGIFYNWDTVTHRATIAAAFPVIDSNIEVKGTSVFHTSATKAIKAVEKGGYSKSKRIHDAMMRYAQSKGLSVQLTIEEYQVGPLQDPDSSKWTTNIYYLLK